MTVYNVNHTEAKCPLILKNLNEADYGSQLEQAAFTSDEVIHCGDFNITYKLVVACQLRTTDTLNALKG